MESLVIFFIAFRFVGCIGGLYFSWKIARMPITPTKTWTLYVVGWVTWLSQNVANFFFTNPVGNMLDQEKPLAFFTIVGSALVVMFFFAATARTYYDLKGKFRGIID